MNGLKQLRRAALTLALACVLAFAPDAYFAMLARAFLPWWALAFLGLAVLAAIRRGWWWGMASATAAMLVIIQIRVPARDVVRVEGAAGLRVASMNVWQMNGRHGDVVRTAIETGADVLAFQEVSAAWATALEGGLALSHPYHRIVRRENCYGIALFSKLPWSEVRVVEVERASFIMADVETAQGKVRICAAHATSPITHAHFKRRNDQLEWLSRELRAAEQPMLIMGDLNTVHWDDAYTRLCIGSGTRPANTPFDITWPSVGPLALIPIDHLLLQGAIAPAWLRTFKVAGSDHRGLIAELVLTHAS
jgi:endonuclease/exonuclease/phosphatase (EEP) superfamily protein YafD